jgi:hypothetical protein
MPVELDQTRVGSLSRMDALQHQALSRGHVPRGVRSEKGDSVIEIIIWAGQLLLPRWLKHARPARVSDMFENELSDYVAGEKHGN